MDRAQRDPEGQRCTRKATHICRHTCAGMHIHLSAGTCSGRGAVPSRKQSEVSGQGLPLRAIGEGGRKEAWGRQGDLGGSQALTVQVMTARAGG